MGVASPSTGIATLPPHTSAPALSQTWLASRALTCHAYRFSHPQGSDHRFACHEARNQYSERWQIEMKNAPMQEPLFCLGSVLLPCCMSMYVRQQVLYGDMNRYVCCGGFYPCSGRMGERNAPMLCLCVESFLCFPASVMSTRAMLQDEMQIQNSECDNCLIGFMVAMQYFSCLCDIAACVTGNDFLQDAAQAVDCVAEFSYCSVCACMQSQHMNQIKYRTANPGCVKVALGVPPMARQLPPSQHMGMQR